MNKTPLSVLYSPQLHFFSDAAVITLNVTEVQTENKIVLLFYFCVDYIISQIFIMNAHSAGSLADFPMLWRRSLHPSTCEERITMPFHVLHRTKGYLH